MKIRYRNFTRIGANYPWASDVPNELIRKPTLLTVWEFTQFIIALACGFILIANADTWTGWSLLVIPLGYLASALCLAFDSHHYRALSTASVLSSMGWLAYQLSRAGKEVNDGVILAAVIVALMLTLVTGYMYVNQKASAYYAWCRSNS